MGASARRICSRNISPRIWPPEPTPCEAKFSPPGLDLRERDQVLDAARGDAVGTTSTLGNEQQRRDRLEVLDRIEANVGVIAGMMANRPLLARNSV